MEQDIVDSNSRLREATGNNLNLDSELKNVCRVKYDQESHVKEGRADLEHKTSDTRFNLTKAENEHEELNKKLDQTNNL